MLLTLIFTIYLRIKREIIVAWETAHFYDKGGIVPDGLCGIGHAYDDHDEDERGVVDEFHEDDGGWLLMMDDDDDE